MIRKVTTLVALPEDEAGPKGAASDGEFSRKIGARARDLRSRLGWPIQELSRRSGLSTGMISQIERGLSTPSLRSLRSLAGALEVPVGDFFAPGEGEAADLSAYRVRHADRRSVPLNAEGVTKAYLMPPGPGFGDMWEFRIAPGGSSAGDLTFHRGDKAGVVLRGRLRLWLDGTVLRLEEGDSFRFPGMRPHRVENPYEKEAVALWIIVPAASDLISPDKDGDAAEAR